MFLVEQREIQIMHNELNFILPWPPSVNRIWSTTRKGNWYVTKVAKDFKNTVYGYVLAKKALNAFPVDVTLSFSLIARPPDNRKRDLDNLTKIVCDALQDATVFVNDSQIKEIYMRMEDNIKEGVVLVTLKRL